MQKIPEQPRQPQPPPQYIQQQVVAPHQVNVGAIPLQGLNLSPAPVDCPVCGMRAYTRTMYETGSQTQ